MTWVVGRYINAPTVATCEAAYMSLIYRELLYTKTVDSVEGRLDWLVKLRISLAIYFRPPRASPFASVTSEEITQINDEAVPENTKKATTFGLAVFKRNG